MEALIAEQRLAKRDGVVADPLARVLGRQAPATP